MTKQLYSISGAAKELGLSRRTIQRWVKGGQLTWHGDAKVGRSAKGIKLAEVKAIANKPSCKGQITRARCRPVWQQVQQFLKAFEKNTKHAPADVIQLLLKAATARADIDFLLYCVDRIREEDELFLSAAMGDPVSPQSFDPLRGYAAGELLAMAKKTEIAEDTQVTGLQQLWYALGRACAWAPAQVDVDVVFDRKSRTASLELSPCWLRKAPSGLVPQVGGHHSAITVRRSETDLAVDAVATKIGLRLEDVSDPDRWKQYQALLSFQRERFLRSFLWKQRVTEFTKGLCFVDQKGIGLTEIEARPIHNILENMSSISSYFGISLDEAKLFVLAVSRIRGDVAARNNRVYSDQRAVPKTLDRVIVRGTILSKVFGVDRHTMAKWLKTLPARRASPPAMEDEPDTSYRTAVAPAEQHVPGEDDDWRASVAEQGMDPDETGDDR